MTEYEVKGRFEPGGDEREFTQVVKAENENVARERTYANLGSRHRLKRTQIDVNEVTENE
jgi:large subunit ribosomal protein LX